MEGAHAQGDDPPRAAVADEPAVELAFAGALALILAGASLLTLQGEAYDWAQYLILGALVPAAVLLLATVRTRRVHEALAIIGMVGVLAYVVAVGRWVAVPLGILQVGLTVTWSRTTARATDMLIAVAAWSATTAIVTSRTVAAVATEPGVRSMVITLGTLLVLTATMAWRARTTARAPWWLTGGALVVLALESLRVDDLFDFVSVHHWNTIIGPADVVRQGGWLLWDVPAQYGFLSTLSIAGFPTTSTWDAFFLIDALACFVTAALVYRALCDHVHAPVALAVTLAAVLWLPGLHPLEPGTGGGVRVTPAAGPFRFVWCQVLLVVAAVAGRHANRLVLGSLVWLAGSLWSAESAVYCACTWLPAYAALVWRRGTWARVSWLALPVVLVGAAAFGINAYYLAWLGREPDWIAFVDGVRAASGGAMAIRIAPWKAVGALLLALWMLATSATIVLRQTRRSAAVAPMLAAFGALWSTTSYFVARSAEVNVTNLLATTCLAGAIALRALPPRAASGVRTAFAALLASVLLLALGAPQDWTPAHGLQKRWGLTVEARRPSMAPDQVTFLRLAGIPPGAPVIYAETGGSPPWPLETGLRKPDGFWLPAAPLIEFAFVPKSRRGLYLERYASRTRASGWLVQHGVKRGFGTERWLGAVLNRTHRANRRVEVGPWVATWYDYAGG